MLRFRDARGKPCKLFLGSVDDTSDKSLANDQELPKVGSSSLTLRDARMLAGILNRDRARGVDIVAKYAKRRQETAAANLEAHAFKARAVEFFVNHKTKRSHERPRRWRDDARMLGLGWRRGDDPSQVEPTLLPGSLCDVWAKRPVTEITRRELEDVIADATAKTIPGLIARNPEVSEVRGRKLFGVLSTYFGWLTKRRYIANDITVGIEAPHAPKARSRILTGAELRWCWLAAGQLPYPHGPVVRLLLLTGQRLNEVGGMHRAELNEDASLWRIPGARTKNHREHQLPLPELAREIINNAPRIEGRDLVFTVGGKSPPSNWGTVKRDLDAKMAAIAHEERGKPVNIPHWVQHDLRRSFASGLQSIGVAPQVIERALNHSSGTFAGIAGIYQRDPLTDDVRSALSSWARYVDMIADAQLHAAHEALLLQGDDDERARNLQHFRDCVRAGGDRWQSYLDALTGKKPAKASDLAERRLRSR